MGKMIFRMGCNFSGGMDLFPMARFSIDIKADMNGVLERLNV